jgi:rhamnulokinase
VLVQARALGVLDGELADLRDLLRRTQQLTRYEPKGEAAMWDAAERRLFG